MSELLQTALVVLVIGSALLYLAVRAWRWAIKGQISGCGSCHGCGSAKTKVVALELTPRRTP